MCTVILGLGTHAAVPLWVAANRDEFYDRPSAPPAVSAPPQRREDSGATGPVPVFGPRDLRRGGTWLGMNRQGVLAVLTNAAPPDRAPVPGLESRGEVVDRVLAAPDLAAAVGRAEEVSPERLRPFYLLLAGDGMAFGVSLDDGRYRAAELAPGIHVQENRPLDLPDAEKVRRARELTAGIEDWPVDDLAPRLHRVLADHEPGVPPLRRLCVHTEVYGTRSTSIVLLGKDRPGWWFSEGHPCEDAPSRVDGLDAFLGARSEEGASPDRRGDRGQAGIRSRRS